jgi:hypothetical protein
MPPMSPLRAQHRTTHLVSFHRNPGRGFRSKTLTSCGSASSFQSGSLCGDYKQLFDAPYDGRVASGTPIEIERKKSQFHAPPRGLFEMELQAGAKRFRDGSSGLRPTVPVSQHQVASQQDQPA